MKGKVYRSTGSWYQVKNEEGNLIDCRLKGKFRIKGLRTTNPVSVGDNVLYDVDAEDKGIITDIEPRTNYIIRKSINLSKEAHILAANVNRTFLVITLNSPPTSTGFIDRYLVTAEAYSIPVTLVFNKIDLVTSASEKEELNHLIRLYEEIGYECIKTSINDPESILKLKGLMQNGVNMFGGHSGAGKSSLLKCLAPKLNIRIGEISESHSKGKHTTTFAEMFDLPFDGQFIDTPGIKGFGVVDMEKDDLASYFPEFQALLPDCKFYNCKHLNEPKCAVKLAVENNTVALERYDSYTAMFYDEEGENYRNDKRGAN